MKILMCVPTLTGGGAERQVCDLADELSARGHEVIIYCLGQEAVISPSNKAVVIITGNLHKAPKKALFSLAAELLKFRRLISREKPDIVHAHLFHANIFSRIALLFKRNPKLICTLHSTHTGSLFREKVYQYTNFACDQITAVSKKAVLEHSKIARSFSKKTVVLYNGIDCDRFSSKQNGVYRKQRFLAAGRLVPEKNFTGLIIAFKEVVKKYPKATLSIAGHGELKTSLEALIESLDLADNVELLGFHNNLPELYSKFDFFVLSSLWEGFGLVVAEAMLVGLPTLATDCGGVNEVMTEKQFLIPANNEKALETGMLRLLSLSDKEYSAIQLRGRSHIEKEFSMGVVASQWVDLYRRLTLSQ